MASPRVRERLAEACIELTAIPSVTGDETAIAAHMETWALSQPHLTRDDVLRTGNGMVIGAVEESKPTIALVGHLDTVPAAGSFPKPRQEGDRIIALGASDMKGGIAVMQMLVENLGPRDLPFTLLLLLYDREEGPYDANGLQPLLDTYELLSHIDLALVMEPTDNSLQLGCLGTIHATATFRGRAAHSARPWQGDNAIHRAAGLLTALRDRPCREVQVEGLTFRDAMSATVAQGGRSRNVVPDSFSLNINYRFPPPADGQPRGSEAIAGAVAAARAELESLCEQHGPFDLEFTDVAPPGAVPVEHPIVEQLVATAQLDIQPKQAWTDVARLSAHGIDAVNFGPGASAQAHQAGEWIDLSAMVESYEILNRLLTTPLRGM